MLKKKSEAEVLAAKAEAGEAVFHKATLKDWHENIVPALIGLGGRYRADLESVNFPDAGCVLRADNES